MGSQIRTVSFDEDTIKILKDKRNNDPNFNLSAYIRQCLVREDGGTQILPLEIIEKNLNESDLKIQMAHNNKEHWEKVYRNYQVKQELKKKEEEEKKKVEERKRYKEAEKRRMITETFKEEMGREMTDFELDQYEKEGKNIWSYCNFLKELEEKNENK